MQSYSNKNSIVLGDGEREVRRGGWGELGGMGRLGWRKSGYGSTEVYILIKGAILGLARDWTIEEFPGVQGNVPSLFLEQLKRGHLNWPYPIATLMKRLLLKIKVNYLVKE